MADIAPYSSKTCSIEAHSLLSLLTLKYDTLTSMSIANGKLESCFKVHLLCFSLCFNYLFMKAPYCLNLV